MHAGHIEVTPEHNGNLFFWHYQQRHIAERTRTVIWFNGGPGCSSMDGAMMELGPYRVHEDSKLVYNEGSWDEFANLLFIDNPVGTGFSYVDTDSYIHELPEMAANVITFLEKWFAIFPEYEQDDIYLAGESYAGQHIPYIAKAIMDRNANAQNQHRWNLSGLLIGNGWIAPQSQYPAYHAFALEHDLYQGNEDLISRVETQEARCFDKLHAADGDDHVDILECEEVLQSILSLTQKDHKCYNMYDVRLKDSYPSCGMNWPPDLTTVTPYLRRADVVEALHINKDKRTGWTECTGAVGGAFTARKSKPSIQLLPSILESGIPILLFSGNQDLICNHIGTESLIHEMSWSNGKGFEISPGVWAPQRQWTVAEEPAGFWQEARNLTYVLFYNASHMVPFDWPRRTRDMLDRFIGVDIGSIGGRPVDSRIDGEKGPETSVGGYPNSTVAQEEEAEKLQEAEWRAYYKSGEAALVVVIIAASVWGWWIWRERRRAQLNFGERGFYSGISNPSFGGANGGLSRFGNKRTGAGDLEAGDFDEAELDDLHLEADREVSHGPQGDNGKIDKYDIGSDSEDDDNAITTGKADGEDPQQGRENKNADILSGP
ncbi:putative pheromone processing carboxypeptidase kex1 [Phaeomoniella chlamydospora]|uniref:Carboxypeptidase n=1 Tax=Phaeomoniella chlamydospora TaxID=158046 RepID=A0A0G2EU34_PHACM|nr:putative pheromone processing carboxypeptidase kex1 [Phaeomoniella chlamydospora]